MQRNSWFILTLLAALSLGFALSIGTLADMRGQAGHLVAGWATSWAVMLAAHVGQRLLDLRNEAPSVTARLIPPVIRLLSLLVIIFVVLFTLGPEKTPFMAGLLTAYFTGLGWEIAWFATRQ